VLSRQTGEAVIIGDDVVVTVDDIGTQHVQISIEVRLFDKSINRTMTLAIDETYSVRPDVTVVIVDIRVDKARIGFVIPQDTALHRKEVYEAMQQKPGNVAATQRSTVVLKPDQAIHVGDKLTAKLTDADASGCRLIVRGELLGGADDGAWVNEPRELATNHMMNLGALVSVLLVGTEQDRTMFHVIAPQGVKVSVE